MKLTKGYILECLDKFSCFEDLHEYNFYREVVRPLEEEGCFENWTWDNGVTKGVLIFKELDFVIKIPFKGCCGEIESHYENSNGSWIGSSRWNSRLHKIEYEEIFEGFTGADTEDGWNYCEVEANLIDAAREEGLNKCFAATELLGYVKDHPIYIQEKCFMFSDAYTSTNKEKYKNRTKADYDSLKEVRERVDFWGIDNDWVLDFLIYWGEEILKRLGQFLFVHDIEDLHNGNIGYRNGIPCLVDYSSYHE